MPYALHIAIARGRRAALDLILHPHLSTESQRELAWRFLRQHGVR